MGFDMSGVPAPLQPAMQEFRAAIGAYRAQYGRDPVRSAPFGKWMDALDSGRDDLHPDDQRALAYQHLGRLSPEARQQLMDNLAAWEAAQEAKQ